MFNKIYKKTKEFMKDEWKFILLIVLTLFITRFPVNCYVITGGGIISATDRIEVADSKSKKGSFNLAYVSELKGTIYTYLLSYIIPSYERENIGDYKISENESSDDIEFRNNLMLNEANNNAIYVAYTNAGKSIKVKKKELYVYYLLDDKGAESNLKIGDKILEIDGKKIDEFDEVRNIINEKNVNDVISIKVEEKGKVLTKTAKVYEEHKNKYIGVGLMMNYKYELSPSVKLKFKESEGGPSGGLMTSLEIYSQLINKDITKGRKIVGTGTIDRNGTVGEIDGIKYKLNGAVKNKADIFIAPTGSNYKEALKEKKKNKYDIKIVEAKNFKQVLEELK